MAIKSAALEVDDSKDTSIDNRFKLRSIKQKSDSIIRIPKLRDTDIDMNNYMTK